MRYLFAALGGLLIACVIVLNLHILVGLENGYAATPAEVADHSLVLAVVDVALLAGGPVAGIVVMAARRSRVP